MRRPRYPRPFTGHAFKALHKLMNSGGHLPSTPLPTINAFWVGPHIGKLQAACLQSFVRQGHRTVLHAYTPPSDVPKGVEVADAASIMPKDRAIAYKASGSFALAANIFRLELLAKKAGLYVDCDCFCVRPIPDDDIILGWEDRDLINNCVLKLPAYSPVLADMRKAGSGALFIPPWERNSRKRRMRMRAMIGRPVKLEDMPWGTLGPRAITFYAKQHGIADRAKPVDFFYPVYHKHAALLRDPGLSLADLITSRTQIVHIWNETQRDLPAAPPGSPMHEMAETLEA